MLTADRTGRLSLALWDPLSRSDDTGALSVQVQRLTALTTPVPAPEGRPRRSAAWTQDHDWVQVRADQPDGAISTMQLRRGEQVQVVVQGLQRSGAVQADASCVLTSAGWVQRDPGVALEQDPLDLWVDGQPVTWRALGRGGVCSEDEHSYTTRFTATKNGPLRFSVLDLDHRDNRGGFKVTLLRG